LTSLFFSLARLTRAIALTRPVSCVRVGINGPCAGYRLVCFLLWRRIRVFLRKCINFVDTFPKNHSRHLFGRRFYFRRPVPTCVMSRRDSRCARVFNGRAQVPPSTAGPLGLVSRRPRWRIIIIKKTVFVSVFLTPIFIRTMACAVACVVAHDRRCALIKYSYG